MAYNIFVSERAQEEIENAIEFYSLNSEYAPKEFIQSLSNAYNSLSLNPYHKIRYKNIAAFKLDKFPHLLYFYINESQKSVIILACFHGKRNPNKRLK